MRMVTPQIETSERMIRVVADSLGGVKTLVHFLEESAPRRNCELILTRFGMCDGRGGCGW